MGASCVLPSVASLTGRTVHSLDITVELDDKDRLDSEQPGNSEPFPMTNLPVHEY